MTRPGFVHGIRTDEKCLATLLYARIKVHSHASHTPLSCALSGICHASQASMCNLRRMSHVLNSLKIPIYGNFSGASRHPCALCWLCHRSRHQLCTMCRASHTRCLVHLYPCIQYCIWPVILSMLSTVSDHSDVIPHAYGDKTHTC